jgi:hypothetical protein
VASIGQAAVGVFLGIRQPCRIRGLVYAVQSVAYLESFRSAIRIRPMRKVRHDKISRLIHGLALGFRTGIVCASLSSCHGGPLLWQSQTSRTRKRGPPSLPSPYLPLLHPSLDFSLPSIFLPYPFFPLPSLFKGAWDVTQGNSLNCRFTYARFSAFWRPKFTF